MRYVMTIRRSSNLNMRKITWIKHKTLTRNKQLNEERKKAGHWLEHLTLCVEIRTSVGLTVILLGCVTLQVLNWSISFTGCVIKKSRYPVLWKSSSERWLFGYPFLIGNTTMYITVGRTSCAFVELRRSVLHLLTKRRNCWWIKYLIKQNRKKR